MPSNETLAAAAFFIAALLAGLHQYLRKPSAPPTAAGTVMSAAIGLGWLERDQSERLLTYMERQTKAQERLVEIFDDKKTHAVTDRIDDLMEMLRDKEQRISRLEGMRVRRRQVQPKRRQAE